MTMTAATPMMMPSMVSRVRTLLETMFFKASSRDSRMLMRSSPPPLIRRSGG